MFTGNLFGCPFGHFPNLITIRGDRYRDALTCAAAVETVRELGAEMICIKAENLGHLLAWSIQQGLTVGELLQMPFYHPVIEEALQAALYDLYAKVDAKNPGPITEVRPL